MNKEIKQQENTAQCAIQNVSHSDKRAMAIKWFKSLPFLRARAYATNHTRRFIQHPYTQLTGREMEEIYISHHCG